MVPRQPTPNAGKKLGRYRIEEELGRGGMGLVYLAMDEATGRHVALKTTLAAWLGSGQENRDQRRKRFLREVEALTKVDHPNVVRVFDAGEEDHPDLGWLLFYAMEFVEGKTLAQLVQERGVLPADEAAAVVRQVAAGLGAAHRAGIVHRDVKPANVFIALAEAGNQARDRGEGRALIGDFGICKIEGATQITRRDQLVGTPSYLAPEQILGGDLGPAADVFALGALFYVVTTGESLRPDISPAALLASARSDACRERVLATTSIPPDLRRVVARCLERLPSDRWANGDAVAEAFAAPGDGRSDANAGDDDIAAALDAPTRAVHGRDGRPEAFDVAFDGFPEDPFGAAPVPAVPAVFDQRTQGTVAPSSSTLQGPAARQVMEADGEEDDDALPLARTESTAMYHLNGQRDRADAGVTDRSPPATAGRPSYEAPPDAPPTRQTSSLHAPATATGLHTRVTVPRPFLLALTALAGAALGLVPVLLLAPPTATAPVLPTVLPRPAMCAEDALPVDPGKAVRLLREARIKRSTKPSEARLLVERATKLDPKNPDLFLEWASLLPTGSDLQRQAYGCVCFLAETSAGCLEARAQGSIDGE
jgi:hypothetical protein